MKELAVADVLLGCSASCRKRLHLVLVRSISQQLGNVKIQERSSRTLAPLQEKSLVDQLGVLKARGHIDASTNQATGRGPEIKLIHGGLEAIALEKLAISRDFAEIFGRSWTCTGRSVFGLLADTKTCGSNRQYQCQEQRAECGCRQTLACPY